MLRLGLNMEKESAITGLRIEPQSSQYWKVEQNDHSYIEALIADIV